MQIWDDALSDGNYCELLHVLHAMLSVSNQPRSQTASIWKDLAQAAHAVCVRDESSGDDDSKPSSDEMRFELVAHRCVRERVPQLPLFSLCAHPPHPPP